MLKITSKIRLGVNNKLTNLKNKIQIFKEKVDKKKYNPDQR